MASPDLVEMEELPAPHRSQQHNPDRSKTDKVIKYLKKLHMQERAVEEAKLAIKPYYQSKDITKDEYKEILRKAVHKICHSKSGEINPVKVGNLVRGYVDKYKMLRKKAKRREEGDGEWVGSSCTPDGKPSCSKTASNEH